MSTGINVFSNATNTTITDSTIISVTGDYIYHHTDSTLERYDVALRRGLETIKDTQLADNIVKLLLEKGANINAHGGTYVNALQAMSAEGHEMVAKILLEKGADVNELGGWLGNTLQAASAGGHEMIAKLLLENGVDVNAKDCWSETAIRTALEHGRNGVMKFLEETGVDRSTLH